MIFGRFQTQNRRSAGTCGRISTYLGTSSSPRCGQRSYRSMRFNELLESSCRRFTRSTPRNKSTRASPRLPIYLNSGPPLPVEVLSSQKLWRRSWSTKSSLRFLIRYQKSLQVNSFYSYEFVIFELNLSHALSPTCDFQQRDLATLFN